VSGSFCVRQAARGLDGFGGGAAGDEFQDTVDGVAAGESDESEEAVGAIFAHGFDEEADGAKEREGGGPGIAPGVVGAREGRFVHAKEKQGNKREQIVGDEEEGEHGDDAFETEDGKSEADQGAEKQADGGRPALVDARDGTEEEAVAAHGVDYASAHEVKRVEAAEERKNHDGAENEVTVSAEDAFSREAERKGVAGDFIHGKDIENGGVDEEIDQDNGEETGEDGAWNEMSGILDFVAEVDDAIPPVVGENGGLNPQEESGDESGADRDSDGSSSVSKRSGFGGLAEMTAKSETSDDHDKEDEALENGGEVLNFAAHADAFPLEQGEENDDGDGGHFESGDVRQVRRQTREKVTQHAAQLEGATKGPEYVSHIFADDDADGAGGAAGGEPVAPADDEAGVVSNGAAREIVLATTFGDGGGELSELEGAHEGVERSTEPYREKQPMIREASSDITGSTNDAGGDRIPDGDGNAEADAEDLQELPAFFAWMNGSERRVGGKRVRSSGQCGVSGERFGYRS
jgi:hypothetical protein